MASFATKSLAADGTKLLAPETPWGSIGEGQAARPAYYEKIEPMRVVILPLGITPDANRDGKIDLADRDKIKPENLWRFWANDDDDSGETGGTDIPQTPGASGTNGYDHSVNGVRDLIDFFPLDLNLKAALEIFPPLRKAMLAAGQDGKGKIAHHMLPIAAKNPELELKFLQRGIDPNDAENGLFLTQAKHDLVHGKGATGWGFGDPYLFQWDRFFKRNPSPDFQAVINFREQLKAIISQEYKHADDIPWPIPKTTQ